MAPHTDAAVAVAVDPYVVRYVASSLKLPSRTPKQIVEDLLARLSAAKQRRESRGLNHWEEFAPSYLERLAARHERLRVAAIEAFFRAEQSKAMARAQSTLGERSEAEDAVSEAFLRLLSGKSGTLHFYRILRLVCTDKLRARYNAAKLFSRRRDDLQGDDRVAFEPACPQPGGGDPLAILLREEEIQEGIQDVLRKRKYRKSRDLCWWDELLSHHRPKLVAGKRPARTNR